MRADVTGTPAFNNTDSRMVNTTSSSAEATLWGVVGFTASGRIFVGYNPLRARVIPASDAVRAVTIPSTIPPVSFLALYRKFCGMIVCAFISTCRFFCRLAESPAGFFQGCDSGAGLGPSIGAHVAEQTTFTSEFSYRRYGGAFCYHFPQFIIYFKELEYADPVVVTAFFTKRTSLAVAHFANTADKPLGKRSVQRSGQRAWLHAKVPHSVYHADGVAGVHRSQRQPSGHRGDM